MDDEGLIRLRRLLQQEDAALLEAAARRQRLAAEIGHRKRESGLPTRDFAREREVMQDARRLARELGLSPRLASDLMELMVRESLTIQERDRLRTGSAADRSALVVGGSGRMGAWFVHFLASQGITVEIVDPASPPARFAGIRRRELDEGDLDHDFLVVAAPLRHSAEILLRLAELRPSGVVFDIGSLKTPLKKGLGALASAGVRVASIHPMFGPDTELLSGRHVIVVETGDPAAAESTWSLFADTMAERVDMDVESHDRAIAFVLGLSHALNIAFADALAGSGETAPRLAELSSTTFDAQLGITARVVEENPDLYYEIQRLNPFGGEALQALERSVRRIGEVVERGDEAAFRGLMGGGRGYLRTREERHGDVPAEG